MRQGDSLAMESRSIVFPQAGQVEIVEEAVAPPGPGEVLSRARLSLVSLGTEGHCLRGVYDPGTYWEEYIRYPFRPGYSMAAEIVAVGQGVTAHKVGDRVTSWAPHAEFFLAPADQLFPVNFWFTRCGRGRSLFFPDRHDTSLPDFYLKSRSFLVKSGYHLKGLLFVLRSLISCQCTKSPPWLQN